MADFSSLKQTIQSYIKQNGNEEITGNILQDVLLAMVTTMGDSAINGLASALQDEITARQNQDGTLQGNIAAETTARQQADTALGGRIDGLQTVINGINTKLAEGYIYAGIATPSTNPGTPSGKVFYIAVQEGTYTNFGGTVVTEGITILKYNGTSWVKEQALFTDGGVFDVSAYNNDTYDDLADALSGNNIPLNIRKGGMSVKFVQSSDNKYVQFRLMNQNWSVTESDWQGVDDVPTAGSNNLVESGGVYPFNRKYIILELWGSDLPSVTALNKGDYFYNAYSKKIALKTGEQGTSTFTEFPVEKNQLYLYKKSFFTSFDSVNLTCISTIFDISDINANSGALVEYARLYDALVALPIRLRDDVQIVSFINSSTHEYEHYRRKSKEWSTSPNNWDSLIIDKTLNESSNNPVSNSAVSAGLKNLDAKIGNIILGDVYAIKELIPDSNISLKFVDVNGNISDTDSNAFSVIKYDLSFVKANKIKITASTNFSNPYYAFYSSSECSSATLIELSSASHSGSTASTEVFDEILIPDGAAYLVINKYVGQDGKVDELAYTIENRVKNSLTGKKWVCVGDSLTAINDKTTKHYFDFVQEETGIIPINCGVSGSGYARRSEQNDAFYQRVQNIPLDADVVTIFGSFNDLGSGLDIGTVNDNNTTTLAGCINTTINNIQNRIPLVRLGIIAPTPWQASQPSTTGGAYNYVEILKSICERRSIPFLDLWRCSNLRPWDADFRALVYNNDPEGAATHPNEIGHSLIAPMFRQFILSLI